MPATLETTLSKIPKISNKVNATLISEFYQYLVDNGSSERHQNNNLKSIIAFAGYLGASTTFYDINRKEQILAFLKGKEKSADEDPEKRWITTWNDYLSRIKYFLRWLHNHKIRKDKCLEEIPVSEWETPSFAIIKKKITKRLSPYSETEIWDRDELFTILKYEPFKRNKAALALMWDLDARNHEVTLLKIKHVRFREQYAEGEIPHEAKTGSGPILLTSSFPYVRDWLNEHPFRNQPDARIICSLINGAPIKSDTLWTIMKQLRSRIERLLETGSVTDPKERQKLEYLLKTKKWNPYCIRHSAITYDSDFLPGFALNKKVRWSMNSKQPARYIKRRMGNDLKKQILARDGILPEDVIKQRPPVRDCPRCDLVNAIENKVCSKCGYPLSPEALEEIKARDNAEIHALAVDVSVLKQDMEVFKEALADFTQILKDPKKLMEIKESS